MCVVYVVITERRLRRAGAPQGSREILLLEDGWTAISADGSRSAQFEHTVLITEDGVEILTEYRPEDDATAAS